MREFYTLSYVNNIKNKRSKQRTIYIIVLVIAVLLVTGIYVYFSTEPYGSKSRTPLLIALIAIIFLTIVYSFLHFDILYGKLNKYYDFLVCNALGIRVTKKVTVLSVSFDTVTKDNLDFYSIVVLDWSDTQNDFVERTLYIDCEIKDVDLKEGEIIKIVTNSNYLLAYEKENV
jgi:hypothetical protein